MLDRNFADYQESQIDVKAMYPGKDFTDAEIEKIPALRLNLKNAILHQLVINRRHNESTQKLFTALDKMVKKYNIVTILRLISLLFYRQKVM